MSASYGLNCGVERGNVTQPLQAACNGNTRCDYRIDVQLLGDPAVGCAKSYIAEWRCGTGAVQSKTVPPEAGLGSTIVIQCPNIAAIAGHVAIPVAAANLAAQEAEVQPPTTGHVLAATVLTDVVSPSSAATTNVASLAASRRLNVEAIKQGEVSATLNGSLQRVTSANLHAWVNSSATFVTRLQSAVVFKALSPSVAVLEPKIKASHALELPYEISGLTKDTHTLVSLRARVEEGTGLLFDQVVGRYVDKIYVYLVSTAGKSQSVELASPVNVMVRAVGASVDPAPVSLAETENPKLVTIAVTNPPTDRFPVTVSAGSDDAGDTVALTVVRPRVSLAAADTNIIGWGLGSTTVYVQVPELAQSQGATIALTTTAGGLEPGTVHLDAHGNGTTTLRSDRSSGARVSLAIGKLMSESATVGFRSPVPFLLLASLGGLGGAFIRGKGRDHWGKALTLGLVMAFAATVAYAVGVTAWVLELTHAKQLASSGEAIVFTVGFLAALVGVTIFLPAPASKRNG